MKVCLFADAQSVHIQQLAPGLAARGVDVHILTHKPAAVAGCTVEKFSVPQAGLNNLRRWETRRRTYLNSFLRNFDLVNIHFLQDWGFFAGGGMVDYGTVGCVVATAWGSDIVDPPGETPAPKMLVDVRRAMLQGATAVTTCGPTFARTVESFADLPVGTIEVAPFGVNDELFRYDQQLARSSQNHPRVGFFKGFRGVYGTDRLVRAVPLVLEQMGDVQFDLVGDGADLAECKGLAESLGVMNAVNWHERRPLSDLPPLIRTWDVSVIPSVHEAFGVAALESSAMGVPVVASDVCGLRDTVRDGETGLLVDTSHPRRFADSIVRLLRDRVLRERMSLAGRSMVERKFRWKDLVDRWVEVYDIARERCCVMV